MIVWTDEALGDLEEILFYYYSVAGPVTADAVQSGIVSEVEALLTFPERIQPSDRVRGTLELVGSQFPYVFFVQVRDDVIVVLNIVHTKRKFPD